MNVTYEEPIEFDLTKSEQTKAKQLKPSVSSWMSKIGNSNMAPRGKEFREFRRGVSLLIIK